MTDDRITWKSAVKVTTDAAAGKSVVIALPAGTRSNGLRIMIDRTIGDRSARNKIEVGLVWLVFVDGSQAVMGGEWTSASEWNRG